jgi:hypothetical protein
MRSIVNLASQYSRDTQVTVDGLVIDNIPVRACRALTSYMCSRILNAKDNSLCDLVRLDGAIVTLSKLVEACLFA